MLTSKADNAVARKAEIKRQIAKVCPVPMTASELNRLADLVDRLAADPGVVWVAGRLDRMDRETGVCRSLKGA